MRELVRAEIAAALGYPGPEDVDTDCAFSELGFDSLTAVELRNRLEAATGWRPEILHDYCEFGLLPAGACSSVTAVPFLQGWRWVAGAGWLPRTSGGRFEGQE